MDSGGYLCISIPTIRRCYLSSYEEIATRKSCGYGDPKYLCHRLQSHMVFMHLDVHRKDDRIQEVINTIIFHKIHCNFGTILNSPLLVVSQFGFSRKSLLSLPVCCIEIFNYHSIIEIPFRLWCEVDCSINRARKSPPQEGNTLLVKLLGCVPYVSSLV